MSSISVTNLNPTVYETKNVQKSFARSSFVGEGKSDSVEISEKNKNKKKLSMWKKALIVGTSVAAVVALALYKRSSTPFKMPKSPMNPSKPKSVNPKNPVNPSKTSPVAPKSPQNPVGVEKPVMQPMPPNLTPDNVAQAFTPLKFKKAKTMEEAKAFAQNKFGINEFTAPDVETANQINYSLTKLYNKTQGAFQGFSNVKYESITDAVNPSVINTHTCAITRSSYKNGVYKNSDLIINRNWFENAEKSIEDCLKYYENSGQIKTLADGVRKIELLTKYRYQDSLNRYYKLYQQGKLTPKAKIDFDSMLYYARNEEKLLLNSRETLVDYIKQELNTDLSQLSQRDYVTEAIKALKYLKVKKGRPVGRENFNQVNGFANLDGIILHEGGHCLHNKKMHLESTLVDLKNMTMTKADKIIAGEVSEYATTNYNEFLQEVFSGILCGDKYSQDVMALYKKLGGVIPAGVR